MKHILVGGTALAAGLIGALSTAQAQDVSPLDWDVRASLYSWFPETRTELTTRWGTVSTELSSKDALEALDFASMIAVEARNGPWSIVGDLFYMDLSLEGKTPLGLLFNNTRTDIKLTSVSAYGLYTIYATDSAQIDAGAGLRAMRTKIDTELQGISVANQQISIRDDWVDPVLAMHAVTKVNEQTSASVWLDYGGMNHKDLSKETWNLTALANWHASERWVLSAGYRALYVERESQGVPYDMRLSGPLLGATFSF